MITVLVETGRISRGSTGIGDSTIHIWPADKYAIDQLGNRLIELAKGLQ